MKSYEYSAPELGLKNTSKDFDWWVLVHRLWKNVFQLYTRSVIGSQKFMLQIVLHISFWVVRKRDRK